jgi:hypothetical protein
MTDEQTGNGTRTFLTLIYLRGKMVTLYATCSHCGKYAEMVRFAVRRAEEPLPGVRRFAPASPIRSPN